MKAEKQKEISSRTIKFKSGKGVYMEDNRPKAIMLQRIPNVIQLVKEEMYSGENLQKFHLIQRILLQESRGGYSSMDITRILSGVSPFNMDIILGWDVDYIKGLSWNIYALEILKNPQHFSFQWKYSRRLVEPLITLVNSIIENGILSSQEASKRKIGVVTSADHGTSDQISVNTFAIKQKKLAKARQKALESMGLAKRGSITVSLERQKDHLLDLLPQEDRIELTDEERQTIENCDANADTKSLLEKILKKEHLKELCAKALQTKLKHHLDLRAQGTIMVLLDKETTGVSSTNVDRETGLPIDDSSQEVTVTKQIEPAHILQIMLPNFMIPYKHRIHKSHIIINFVDKREINAYYTTAQGEVLIKQIIAPDYVEGIARQLIDKGVISTHIVTTDPQ